MSKRPRGENSHLDGDDAHRPVLEHEVDLALADLLPNDVLGQVIKLYACWKDASGNIVSTVV